MQLGLAVCRCEFAGVTLRGLFLCHRRLINIIMAVSLLLCAMNLILH